MHRADLNYLIDMMGSEIAIGHSYVRGGDMPEVPASTGGQLGADFTIDQGRYRITKIYDAESWNPDLRAPLAGPGIDAHVGDYLLAVNGEELRAPDNLFRLLDGTANRQVGAHAERAAGDGRRAARDGDPRRERPGASHPRVGGAQPPRGGFAVEGNARVRLHPEHRAARATRASTVTTSRSRTGRARSSTSATTAADRPPTTSSTCCSATSTATSTTWPATACRSPARRPASGARRS